MVISPPSAGGFGRQLVASSASTTHTTARNNKLRCVVFLMGAFTPPDSLDRPKSRCHHRFYYRGYAPSIPHQQASWESNSRILSRVLCAVCSNMRAAVMPSLITDAAYVV